MSDHNIDREKMVEKNKGSVTDSNRKYIDNEEDRKLPHISLALVLERPFFIQKEAVYCSYCCRGCVCQKDKNWCLYVKGKYKNLKDCIVQQCIEHADYTELENEFYHNDLH